MGLKELVAGVRAEYAKGAAADSGLLEEGLAKLEAQAAKDQAMVARLEAKAKAAGDRSPEEVAKLVADFEELKAASEGISEASAEKDRKLEKLARERAVSEKALSDALSGEKQAVARLVLDAGLTAELLKAKVKPSLIPAAKALIREKGILSVEAEGDVRRAVAKVMEGGKESRLDLGAYVAGFVASGEGLEFVLAEANSGGGAQDARGAGVAQGKVMREEAFAALPPKEKAKFIASGGSLVA